jgi:hypothetical protein
MLFLATHTHNSLDCPYIRNEGRAMVKRIFTQENMARHKVRLVGAYVSCPKSSGEEHRNIFIVQADNAAAVTKFFGPMPVDLRNVTPFSEVLKTL